MPLKLILTAIAFGIFGVLASIGGLVSYWRFVDWLDFRRRGYRIRLLHPQTWRWQPGPQSWAYEEREANGNIRGFAFVRHFVSGGYPAKSVIRFPGPDAWSAEVPAWAGERREQIVERVLDVAGRATTRLDDAA